MKVDIFAILFVISVIGAVILTGIPTAVLGIIYGVIMMISIINFGAKIGNTLLTKDFESFLIYKKLGRHASILLNEEYRILHKGFSGYVRVASSITLVSFGISLLILRFVLPQITLFVGSEQKIEAILVLAIVAVGILSALLAPLSIPYWAINSSRIRILNKKKMLLDYPGSLLRKVFSMIGAGNIVVFAYFLYSAMSAANDIVAGLVVGLQIAIFLYGAIGLGALIASIIIGLRFSSIFNDVLIKFEEKYEKVSISKNEFIEILSSAIEREEIPSEEAEEVSEMEEAQTEQEAEESDDKTSEKQSSN